MNCASLVELIVQSAGMVDVNASNQYGLKTLSGLTEYLGLAMPVFLVRLDL